MKSTHYVIIGVVVAVLAGTVFLLSKSQVQKQPTASPPVLRPDEPSLQYGSGKNISVPIAVAPQTPNATVGSEVNFVVTLNQASVVTAGVETHMTFDPSVLSVTKVTPLSIFADPVVLENKVDNAKGTIDFSVGTLKAAPAAVGQVALISAKVLKAGSATIMFDKQQTKVAVKSTDGKVIYNQSETKLQFGEHPVTIK